MAKKALLVVSFGSTHEDTIKDTITAAERDLALAFPDRQLYTAWTSRFIRKTMEARDRHIDSPAEAIERMELAGVTDCFAKSLGTDNAVNVVKATAEGLKNMESPESVASRRGVSVGRIFGRKEA